MSQFRYTVNLSPGTVSLTSLFNDLDHAGESWSDILSKMLSRTISVPFPVSAFYLDCNQFCTQKC